MKKYLICFMLLIVLMGCEKRDNSSHRSKPEGAWGDKWTASCKDPFGEVLFSEEEIWAYRSDIFHSSYIEFFKDGEYYRYTTGHSCQIHR